MWWSSSKFIGPTMSGLPDRVRGATPVPPWRRRDHVLRRHQLGPTRTCARKTPRLPPSLRRGTTSPRSGRDPFVASFTDTPARRTTTRRPGAPFAELPRFGDIEAVTCVPWTMLLRVCRTSAPSTASPATGVPRQHGRPAFSEPPADLPPPACEQQRLQAHRVVRYSIPPVRAVPSRRRSAGSRRS